MRPLNSIIVCERKLDFNLNIRRVKSEELRLRGSETKKGMKVITVFVH